MQNVLNLRPLSAVASPIVETRGFRRQGMEVGEALAAATSHNPVTEFLLPVLATWNSSDLKSLVHQ